jgi:hypothetical protein
MDIWNEFVLKYFPDYYSSELISRANDLDLLMNDNYEVGSNAEKILNNEYRGTNWNNDLENDYHNIMFEIYEKSIEGYLKTLSDGNQ